MRGFDLVSKVDIAFNSATGRFIVCSNLFDTK